MTWSGHFTVRSVGEQGDADGALQLAVLTASTDEKVRPWAGHEDEKFAATEAPALASNTEGKLVRARLELVFEEDAPPLAVGDVVSVTGHFTKH
jgi:hypothetical protein